MKFQVGTMVQLKSGGPKMTVVTICEHDSGDDDGVEVIECGWFVRNIYETQRFDIRTLKVIKDE